MKTSNLINSVLVVGVFLMAGTITLIVVYAIVRLATQGGKSVSSQLFDLRDNRDMSKTDNLKTSKSGIFPYWVTQPTPVAPERNLKSRQADFYNPYEPVTRRRPASLQVLRTSRKLWQGEDLVALGEDDTANARPSNSRPSGENERVKNQFRYPLTPPEIKFRIGVISDLDTESTHPSTPGKWVSYLREGNLYVTQNTVDAALTNVSIEWDDNAIHPILSGFSYSFRGMELSTLNVFNGNLYSCDDRTGIIYELMKDTSKHPIEITATPWAILADGNFTGNKGFKCEWATVKDGDLYVGGHGVDIVETNSSILNHNAKFVKRVTSKGEVTHLDWSKFFDKMATALNVHFPGYVVHEAAGWSETLQSWMFMPRKISKERYEEKADFTKGSNVILLADENFDNVQVGHVGQNVPSHGFSSFKWIPGTEDKLVVAIKSLEMDGQTETYIMAFDLQGNVLLPESKISTQKYEGIEFL